MRASAQIIKKLKNFSSGTSVFKKPLNAVEIHLKYEKQCCSNLFYHSWTSCNAVKSCFVVSFVSSEPDLTTALCL